MWRAVHEYMHDQSPWVYYHVVLLYSIAFRVKRYIRGGDRQMACMYVCALFCDMVLLCCGACLFADDGGGGNNIDWRVYIDYTSSLQSFFLLGSRQSWRTLCIIVQ